MTPDTFGPYILTALPYAGAEALEIAGWCIGPFTVLFVVILAVRHRRHLRDLMDDGDGQGGIPPIARKLAKAEAETQAISMRHLSYVIDPDPALGCPCCPGARSNDCSCATPCGDPQCQAIDPGPGCRWCTDPAYTRPEDCTCECRCEGIDWCSTWWPRDPVPVEWERDGGWR